MRSITFALAAALLFGGSFAASAQTKKVTCKGLDEAACVAPDCKWNPATTTKKGKEKKAFCSKVSAKKAKKAA